MYIHRDAICFQHMSNDIMTSYVIRHVHVCYLLGVMNNACSVCKQLQSAMLIQYEACDVYSRDSCRCEIRKASLPINSMPKWSVVSGSREERGRGER